MQYMQLVLPGISSRWRSRVTLLISSIFLWRCYRGIVSRSRPYNTLSFRYDDIDITAGKGHATDGSSFHCSGARSAVTTRIWENNVSNIPHRKGSTIFTVEFVKIRFPQEQSRCKMPDGNLKAAPRWRSSNAEHSRSQQVPIWAHFQRRDHREEKFWTKYRMLKQIPEILLTNAE